MDAAEISIPIGEMMIDCYNSVSVSWTIDTRSNVNLVNTTMLLQAFITFQFREHLMIHSGHYRWP